MPELFTSQHHQVQQLLRELKVQPHRLRGQNFLVDAQILAAIVEVYPPTKQDVVLEIGPGLGALSQHLAAKAQALTLLEIEPAFVKYLKSCFTAQPNINIHQGDALLFDYQAYFDAPYLLFANVPYHITTPLLQKLLLAGGPWQRMVLLLQKEAALRIAQGKGRNNSPLTLLCSYFGQAKIEFIVPPQAFYPAPAVDSAVISISRFSQPAVDEPIDELLPLIHAGFAERRKLLSNNLASSAFPGDKAYWQEGLQQSGIAEQARAENLAIQDYAALLRWHKQHPYRNGVAAF